VKKILLVDDEKNFLTSLKAGLKHFEDIFITDICFSVDEAEKLIKKNNYALIITDIRMPHRSGIDLLIHLKKIKFKGGIKVMSAHKTEEDIEHVKGLGIVEVISKPFDFEWFENMILDFFEKEIDTNVVFESIELTSVLQVINIDRKTVALQITKDGEKGLIYFKDGEIINAEFKNSEGEEALLAIMKLNSENILIKKIKKKIKKTINTPFLELMMNLMRKFDEIKKDEKQSINSNISNKKIKKEGTMNKETFEKAQKIMQEELKEGLIEDSFWVTGDGQPLVSYAAMPDSMDIGAANALFDRVTAMISKSLKDASFPALLNRYYLIDLTDNIVALIVLLDEFQWGMVVDISKTTLGIVLNVALPKALNALNKK